MLFREIQIFAGQIEGIENKLIFRATKQSNQDGLFGGFFEPGTGALAFSSLLMSNQMPTT